MYARISFLINVLLEHFSVNIENLNRIVQYIKNKTMSCVIPVFVEENLFTKISLLHKYCMTYMNCQQEDAYSKFSVLWQYGGRKYSFSSIQNISLILNTISGSIQNIFKVETITVFLKTCLLSYICSRVSSLRN